MGSPASGIPVGSAGRYRRAGPGLGRVPLAVRSQPPAGALRYVAHLTPFLFRPPTRNRQEQSPHTLRSAAAPQRGNGYVQWDVGAAGPSVGFRRTAPAVSPRTLIPCPIVGQPMVDHWKRPTTVKRHGPCMRYHMVHAGTAPGAGAIARRPGGSARPTWHRHEERAGRNFYGAAHWPSWTPKNSIPRPTRSCRARTGDARRIQKSSEAPLAWRPTRSPSGSARGHFLGRSWSLCRAPTSMRVDAGRGHRRAVGGHLCPAHQNHPGH